MDGINLSDILIKVLVIHNLFGVLVVVLGDVFR